MKRDAAAVVLESPNVAATLKPADARVALAKMLVATMALMEKWVTDQEEAQVAEMATHSDRLLNTKEMAERLGCSIPTLVRRAKAGKYGFMFMHGGNWAGSEDGLERWIKNQVKRSA